MLVADLAGPGPGKGEIVTSLIQLWKAGKGWESDYKSSHKESIEHI